MAVFGSYNYSNLLYYDTAAGPLPGATVWEQAASAAFFSDPASWLLSHQDFEGVTVGTNTIPGWAFTNATSGTVAADTTNPSGALTISAGAATAGQGVNFQMAAVPFKLHATYPTVFEARIKFTGLSNLKVQALVGLAAASTTLITSNAVGTTDKVAFAGVTTTGVLSSNTTASATATTGTGLTLVNATWYRLGFVATAGRVTFYVNGVSVSSSTTNIPTAAMAPAVVIQSNSTDTAACSLDYIRVFAPRQ